MHVWTYACMDVCMDARMCACKYGRLDVYMDACISSMFTYKDTKWI